MPKSTQRDGRVVNTAPDDGALEAEFKVWGRLERNLFRVRPRADRHVMTLERPHKKVVADETRNARDVRNIERFNPVDPKAPDVLRIVAPGHATAHARSIPVVHFSKGDLVA